MKLSIQPNHQTEKNSQIQLDNNSSNDQQFQGSRKNKSNRTIIFLMLAAFILVTIYIYKHQKQQFNIKLQLEQQSKIIGQIRNQVKQFKKLQRRQNPIRNLKQPFSQDLSKYYCLKHPLIPNKLPPKGQRDFLVNTRYGFQLYGDAGNGEGEHHTLVMMEIGTFGEDGINLLGRLLRPGYKLLNLGAHDGLEALVAANILGPKGQLFIFQPASFSHMIVTKSFQLNNFTDRSIIYNLAASDVKMKSKIYIDMSNTGRNALAQSMDTYKGKIYAQNTHYKSKDDNSKLQFRQQDVQVDLVDNVIPPVQIDVAFIDVESHEVQALLGMKQTIKRSPYMIIMLQWAYLRNQRQNPEKATQLIRFLIQRGYRFYRFYGFNAEKCDGGSYGQIMDPLNDLLKIYNQNLIFAPCTVILP